ncbi:hypothetical protein VZT92_002097 [Zoarces viviparus]|uniref:Uncharacterized protein n=1 Tax=Zoarces viviparus TaxID=48416 RepID=A0AAW1G4J1_ZOAVI
MDSISDLPSPKYFQLELDATRKRVEERGQQKRKRTESQHTGCKCRFCQMELKQDPNRPHIHTGFPGLTGKYIYCPGEVSSLYKDQSTEKETTWNEFQGSAFYETEKKRWEVEKGK